MATTSITSEQARSLSLILGQIPDAANQVWFHNYDEYIDVDIDDEKGNTLKVYRIRENGDVVRGGPNYLTNEDISNKLS
jgi:hypothetical protein